MILIHQQVRIWIYYLVMCAQALQMFRLLKDNPRPPRAKELRGKLGAYRIWLAGRWRIAYQVDDAQHVVVILRVRLKEDIDYDSLRSPE